MTSFARTKRLSDLWRLTFFRKFSEYEKSKDCQSRTVPEMCSSSTSENDNLCPPCPSSRSDPPFPCPKPPMCDHDSAGNFFTYLEYFQLFCIFQTFAINFYILEIVNLAVLWLRRDLDAVRLELKQDDLISKWKINTEKLKKAELHV